MTPFEAVMHATDKPVIAYGRTAQNVTDTGRAFQAKAGIPFVQGLPETLRAAQNLIRYGEAVRRGVGSLPPPAGSHASLEGANEVIVHEHGLLVASLAGCRAPPPTHRPRPP